MPPRLLTEIFKKIRKIPVSNARNIDIVYLFVDMNDKRWMEKFKKHNKGSDVDTSRYQQANEIYLSLSTVEFYFPSVHNIYVITDQQTLDSTLLSTWLTKKIHYVDHRDIIPEEFLPTFNSITIESFIHRIPNLSECFLYFNDDCMLGNNVDASDLLNAYNVPIVYHLSDSTQCDQWTRNARDIFREMFDVVPDFRSTRTVHVMSRKAYQIAWVLFGDRILKSLTRMPESKNVMFWYLVYCVGTYFGMYTMRRSNPSVSIYVACDQTDVAAFEDDLKRVKSTRPKFFCIDNLSEPCFSTWVGFGKDIYTEASMYKKKRNSKKRNKM